MPDDKVIPVRVALRCRPLVPREESEGCRYCVQFVPGEPQLILGKDKHFTYDYVFNAEVPQAEVYDKAVSKLVKGLFKGYNATVLAYGQTGSGKTFSMGGGYGECTNPDDELNGIIPRVIRSLYQGIEDHTDTYDFTLRVSYIELYKEDLHDLLQPIHKREPIQIREEAQGGIKLMGLTERVVLTEEETLECLESGAKGRTTGATAMNSQSSRSHAIFTLHLERSSKEQDNDLCHAKFHLVDLAGSERAKKTMAEGERFKEGVNINKGLLALGNVISALGDDASKRIHIPYRDSKLTRLLQDSLGGNSHTVMIACVSPADSNMEETLSTLRYADRARKIKNKPVVNRDPQAAEIMRLRQMVQDLQVQMLQGGKVLSMSSTMTSSSMDSSENYKNLKEKFEELEEEKFSLQKELRSTWAQNHILVEQNINLEMSNERLQNIMEIVKQKTGMSISRMDVPAVTGEGDGEEKGPDDDNLSMIKEIHQKIAECEKNETYAMTTIAEEEDGTLPANSSQNTSANTSLTDDEQMSKQAEFQRRLAEINDQLHRKEHVVKQMLQNDEAMTEMRNKYENDKIELMKQIDKLSGERETLVHELEGAKHNTASSKVAEQRRKRLKELEEELGKARKTLRDQAKVVKMKEQSDQQLKKMTEDIKDMKSKRVKLMKQMREEAENFRKWKQAKDKEVLQLKSKDRKRQIEMVKLQRTNERQQTVYRRKAEEAGAANKRLKEALAKQKVVQEERNKKQEINDMSGIGARIRKWLSHELEVVVSVEEAKRHLEGLKLDRADLVKQVKVAKQKLECGPSPAKRKMSGDGTPEDADQIAESLKTEIKLLNAEVELRSAQISDLQEKVMDAGQDDKTKSRWQNVHTMVEAKCAMKYLLNEAVNAKLEESKLKHQSEEAKTRSEESSKHMKKTEKELKQNKIAHDEDILSIRKEYENKVLYLLNQLKNSDSSTQMMENTLDEDLKTRLKFQEQEIERLAGLEEDLEQRTAECARLRKELTRATYNLAQGRDGTLLPDIQNNSLTPKVNTTKKDDSKFFSPAFLKSPCKPKKKKPKPAKILVSELESSSEEEDFGNDDEGDPEWQSGHTPWGDKHPKKRRTTSLFNQSDNEPSKGAISPPAITEGCICKGKCVRCNCAKANRDCDKLCNCNPKRCKNRHKDIIIEETESEESGHTLDTTYNVGGVNTSTPLADSLKDTSGKLNRDSLDKSKNKSSDTLYKENRPSIDDPADPFNGGVKKKRKLLNNGQAYFGPLNE